jgi:hypothetical protein
MEKTAIDYGVREKQKYLSQRMSVTNFVHKNSYASGPKMSNSEDDYYVRR